MYDLFFIVIHVLKELLCIRITLCYVGVFWVLFISMLYDRSFEQLSILEVFSVLCEGPLKNYLCLGYSMCYVGNTFDGLTLYFGSCMCGMGVYLEKLFSMFWVLIYVC